MKPDLDKLKVADHDRLAEALAYALRHYFGRGSRVMLTASWLASWRSGF
jgi:hypothetical protein